MSLVECFDCGGPRPSTSSIAPLSYLFLRMSNMMIVENSHTGGRSRPNFETPTVLWKLSSYPSSLGVHYRP